MHIFQCLPSELNLKILFSEIGQRFLGVRAECGLEISGPCQTNQGSTFIHQPRKSFGRPGGAFGTTALTVGRFCYFPNRSPSPPAGDRSCHLFSLPVTPKSSTHSQTKRKPPPPVCCNQGITREIHFLRVEQKFTTIFPKFTSIFPNVKQTKN